MHRVVMENNIGRLLETSEEIHHIDGNRTNNNIKNLQILSKSEHSKITQSERPRPSPVQIKCECGKVFIVDPGVYKYRYNRSQGKQIYCCKQCA